MDSKALLTCTAVLCSGVIGYFAYPPIFGLAEKPVAAKSEKTVAVVPQEEPKHEPEPATVPESLPEPDPTPKPVVVETPEEEPEEEEDVEEIAEVEAEDDFELSSLTRTPEELKALQEMITEMSQKSDPAYMGHENASAWKRPDNAKKRLAGKIVGALKKKGDKNTMKADRDVMLFLAGKDGLKNRLALAQWAVLDKADSTALISLCQNSKFRNFLGKFINDLQWIESFVYSGACQAPEKALEILSVLAEHDPEILKVGKAARASSAKAKNIPTREGLPMMKRRIATAIAAEYGRNGWTFSGEEEAIKYQNMLPPKTDLKDRFSLAKIRYDYFVSSWRKGLLNPTFDELADWDMRIVCGWKDKNRHGGAATLEWQRDNAALPEGEAYNAACQVPYRLINFFGDSIHSSDYYKPFDTYYNGNYNKEVRDVGSVCGGNAHFGASSCIAQGIPAMTMGEPGHCAYSVRVNGKWKRNFSVSPKHSMHWQIWGEHAFSFLDLTQEFYSEGYRSRLSQQVAMVAAALAQNKNPKNSVRVYELATDIQPLNYPAWSTFFASLKELQPNDRQKWMQVNEAFCKGMGSKHPEVCMIVLNKEVYPTLMGLLKSRNDKLKVCEDFLGNMNETEDEPKWGLEKLLQSQLALFGTGGVGTASSSSALGSTSVGGDKGEESFAQLPNGVSESDARAYFKVLTKCLMTKPAFAAEALSWGSEVAGQVSQSAQREFTKMALESQGASGGNDEKLLATALVGAENNKDITTFRSIAQRFKKKGSSMPNVEPYPGELLSSGGLIRFSSLNERYDDPSEHPGVIEKTGGRFHTDNKGESEWAEVVMRRPGEVTGIVIVTNGNEQRLHDWRIETSMDGSSWTPFADLPDKPSGGVIRVDGKNTQCQCIRLYRKGKDFFNLKAILVYGHRNA